MSRFTSTARFAPPDDFTAPRYERLQERYDDLKWDYDNLRYALEDELEDESKRAVLEERLLYLRMMVQDVEQEMEEYD